jgi:TPR repeat protein
LLCVVPLSAQFFKNLLEGDKKVPVIIQHPPTIGLTVRRIAFGSPSGACAEDMVDSLLIPDFQKQNVDVVDQQHLDQILAEQNFSRNGAVSQQNEISLGRILGPSVLIFVKIYECNPDMQHLVNNQRNYLNNTVQTTYISQTRFSVRGSVEVSDLTTGQILGSNPFESHQQRQTTSVSGPPEFPPQDEVKEAAMRDAAAQVHDFFFPWIEEVSLTFYDDKDCGLKEAYQLYQSGDHAGALQMSENNLTQCKASHKNEKTLGHAYYDAGLTSMVAGQYEQAQTYLRQAMQMKGSDAAVTALDACSRAQAGAAQVQQYQAKLARIPTPAPMNLTAQAPAVVPTSTQAAPGPGAAAGTAAKPSPATRLRNLDQLLKQGLITRKEYDAKKAQILSEL